MIWRAIGASRPYLFVAAFFLASCATTSHQFSQPAANWQTRTGQLMYRNQRATVIGDVLVQFSKSGDFQLTFSKGPSVTLLTYRQDASYAQISGAIVGHGWSGEIKRAPQNMRGWLGLRDAIAYSKDRHLVQYVVGPETFVFRF